jgi:hypothetical protein
MNGKTAQFMQPYSLFAHVSLFKNHVNSNNICQNMIIVSNIHRHKGVDGLMHYARY